MSELPFAILLLLPSVALCYLILSTFYGAVKAYLAISWIPFSLFLIISLFGQMEYIQSFHALNFKLLLAAVGWISFVQALLGLALVVNALVKKEDWVIPAIAALITVIPFTLTR